MSLRPILVMMLPMLWLRCVAAAESAPAIDVDCALTATLDTPIGRLASNAWNRSAARTYPAKQCLRSRRFGDATQFGWSWDWPATGDTLLSFPQVVLGWRPWDGGKSSHALLPARTGDVRTLRLSYAMQTHASGKYALATTLWITRTGKTGSEANPRDIVADVAIWTDGDSFDPFGSKVGETAIGSARFEVWFARDLGDATGDGPRWNFVGYRALMPQTATTLDLNAFLKDAVARGYVSADHFVSNVEIGNEIMSGRGETWIRRLKLEVE